MIRIMLDLETMGQQQNAAIVAIGACAIDAHGKITNEFYETVDLQSNVDAGLEIDPSTVVWWMRQGNDARMEIVTASTALHEALIMFSEWIADVAPSGNLEIWGNGSDFDNSILSNAYRKVGIRKPWKFWQNRCYRTVKSMHPNVKIDRHGTHHNALDDARSQARHLSRILESV